MAARRVYAVGDIHGQLEMLAEVQGWISDDRAAHGGDDVVVYVGDLVDRGPDSAGVIRYLIDGLAAGEPWVVLKGNHDRMMQMYLQDPESTDPMLRPDYIWLARRVGGLETLASYGVDIGAPDVHAAARAAVPAGHLAFLAGLKAMHVEGEAVYVHAGIRPGVALGDQTEDDLLWIRAGFLDDARDHGPLIIHGHTNIKAVRHYGNRVNIDSSAAYGGPLSVIVVEGREVSHLTGSGRAPLLPDNR